MVNFHPVRASSEEVDGLREGVGGWFLDAPCVPYLPSTQLYTPPPPPSSLSFSFCFFYTHTDRHAHAQTHEQPTGTDRVDAGAPIQRVSTKAQGGEWGREPAVVEVHQPLYWALIHTS